MVNSANAEPETPVTSVQNLSFLIGAAKARGLISPVQEQCAIESLWCLGRAAGVDETTIWNAVGPNPLAEGLWRTSDEQV